MTGTTLSLLHGPCPHTPSTTPSTGSHLVLCQAYYMGLAHCYRHNLTGPRDGPRATWAEGNHRNSLRIGFYVNMSRAGMAMYLVRIV
jgi:hypothetical protein